MSGRAGPESGPCIAGLCSLALIDESILCGAESGAALTTTAALAGDSVDLDAAGATGLGATVTTDSGALSVTNTVGATSGSGGPAGDGGSECGLGCRNV